MCVKNGKLNIISFYQSVRVGHKYASIITSATFLLSLKFFHEDVTDGIGTTKE